MALEAKDLRTPAHPKHPLSFNVRAGEVVGLAGLVGAGRTELLETLFGVTPPLSGELTLAGQAWRVRNPHDAIESGVALAPEDRKQQGLVLEMSVRENVSLATLKRDQRKGFLNRQKERALCDEMIPRLNIKTPSPKQEVRLLSGGNQQKVVLGKWLATRPRLLLLDEPTRGIDVGAKREIYQQMDALAREGVAILFVSSEMEEILTLSDRVLVMHEGRITGELNRNELNEEAVMRLATATQKIGV
jgi:ribose transport system ATP-binding protein